jgi:N-formylglutamate deformylase
MRWTIEPAAPPVAIVACLPHGGVDYPEDLAQDLAMSPDTLWSDRLTRELYDFLPELGITTITTGFSRFVADVNRDPDGEQHGSFRDSVVAAHLRSGRQLYRKVLTPAQIRHRIKLAHEPFHRALDAAIESRLKQFPRILLLDLHSFGIDLPGDIIVGDRHGTTAQPEATSLVRTAFTQQTGFDVRMNQRYIGGWTIRRFTDRNEVDAVAVEVNQRCYLDFQRRRYPDPPPPGDFEQTKRRLQTALEKIATNPFVRTGSVLPTQQRNRHEVLGRALKKRVDWRRQSKATAAAPITQVTVNNAVPSRSMPSCVCLARAYSTPAV